MSFVRSAACVLATLLLAGAGVASSEETDQEPEDAQCLNVALDHVASEFNVFVTVFGAIGVGVSSPEPGQGLAFHAYVVPELCRVSLTPLTASLNENPILKPDGSFPLLA